MVATIQRTSASALISAASESRLRAALSLPRERDKLLRLEAELIKTIGNAT